jgi:hypothetical protein
MSCAKREYEITGFWKVHSNYYKATYKIVEEQNKLVGKVIYYNDDTTILYETGTKKDIFLFNLKPNKTGYIDAVSGATKTNSNTSIKTKHRDTLEVTSYIQNKPLIETWIRIKNNTKKHD